MADLSGSGRIAATNGGASRIGPVPVTQNDLQPPPPIPDTGRGATGSPSQGPQRMRTPRTIMAERQRKAEMAEMQRQQQEEEEQARRRQAEQRRRAPVAPPAVPGAEQPMQTGGHRRAQSSNTAPVRSGYSSRQPAGQDASSMGPLPDPPPVPTQQPPRSRANPGNEPRAVQPQMAGPGQQRAQQPTRPAAQAQASTGGASQRRSQRAQEPDPEAGPSTAGTGAQRSTQSSFPHAFERWEDLSSHWEGLTSFWIHKLEHDAEEVSRIPLGQQMSRQITDLAAAGANLFHAVVELQRLRASSERKFSRWFIETRSDMERAREINADLERQLNQERSQQRVSGGQVQDLERRTERAEKIADEARRELAISKDEARRAWEELGRREQEERERQQALRDGTPILIGGVQVFPTLAGASRQASLSQRPSTRDGPSQQGQYPQVPANAAQYVGQQQPQYIDDNSPTDTDPFTETRQQQPYGTSPYIAGATPATSSASARTMIPTTQQQAAQAPSRSIPVLLQQQQRPQQGGLYSHPGTSAERQYIPSSIATASDRGQAPYVATPSNDEDVLSASDDFGEDGDEFEIDPEGNIRRDAAGRPIPWRRGLRSSTIEDDDDDVQEDIQRERMLARQYGTSQYTPVSQPVTYPSIPPSSTAAMAQIAAATASASAGQRAQPMQQGGLTVPGAPVPPQGSAEYEGEDSDEEGFDDPSRPAPMWDTMRHHHPTRLSDVMEEDERSRTTGE